MFAVGDVAELFGRDLEGRRSGARLVPGYHKITDPLATSVMLLDNAKLKHWRLADDLERAVGS